jgi:hypothetical protein
MWPDGALPPLRERPHAKKQPAHKIQLNIRRSIAAERPAALSLWHKYAVPIVRLAAAMFGVEVILKREQPGYLGGHYSMLSLYRLSPIA